MRLFACSCIILILTSCAGRISTVALMQEADSTRVTLMRKESEVYGNFFKVRTFHQDLMQMLNSNTSAPYPQMDSLFGALVVQANNTVMQRILYDTVYNKIKLMTSGKKHITHSPETDALIARYDSLRINLPAEQKRYSMEYDQTRLSYQEKCRVYGVIRMGPADYAELISIKLDMWQDSLEEIGRMIAKSKQHLKKQFPQQKGQEYYASYQPISELEAMLKNFDSMLSQLQNSLSRFEEGNKDDFIYFGPEIRQRMEVQVTDDIIGQLALQMKACHEKEKTYYQQWK